jgi:hypothetical protein
MGRGPKRNETDRPKLKLEASEKPLGTTGNGRPAFTGELCPVSIEVKIEESHLAVPGVPIDLKKLGKYFDIMVASVIIGHMNAAQSRTVESCGNIGIHYRGKIIIKKGITYAQFQRI